MIKLKKDNPHTIVVLDDKGVDKGEFSAPPHIIDAFMQMQEQAQMYRELLAHGFVSVKAVNDMDALYKHTLADPNADDPYLRGYTNGIRLMHAALHGREPDFAEAPDRVERSVAKTYMELKEDAFPQPTEPDRSKAWVALEWLKSNVGSSDFDRRLLVLLDILINDRR